MNEHEQFHHCLLKIKERLTIIFDHNIPNGKPIIESDAELLHVLYKLYYHGEIDKLSTEPLHVPEPVQTSFFPTTTAGLFDQTVTE